MDQSKSSHTHTHTHTHTHIYIYIYIYIYIIIIMLLGPENLYKQMNSEIIGKGKTILKQLNCDCCPLTLLSH